MGPSVRELPGRYTGPQTIQPPRSATPNLTPEGEDGNQSTKLVSHQSPFCQVLANGDGQNTTARLKGARRTLPTSTRPLKSIQYHSSPQVSTACLVSKAQKVIKAGLDKTPLLISASVMGNRRAVTKQESPTLLCSHPPPVKRVKGTSS